MKRTSLLGIPVHTLASYRDMGIAVVALRKLGLVDVLRKNSDFFRDHGDLSFPPLDHDNESANLRNFPHFLQCTDMIYDAAEKIPADDFVFCLGGECGLVVGTLAAFRQTFKGQPGMLWFDAHGDFNTPETSPSGFVGGMPLAFICGHGPKFSSKIESSRPLLEEEHLVHLGGRELDPMEARAMEASPMRRYSASRVRQEGSVKVAHEVADFLAEATDWIVVHLDIDVVDSAVIPALNYPSRGGLTLEEVKAIIEAVKRTGKLKVFNLTAYNPTLDRDESSGKKIVGLMSEIFS